MNDFAREVSARIQANKTDSALKDATQRMLEESIRAQYSYNFAWLGRPIIQYPQDIVAMQELVWRLRPDVIVETGIAHGGSLILSASLLALLDYVDAAGAGEILDPAKPKRRVIGVDIDIRAHNRTAVEQHPMANRIEMIQGSAIDPEIVADVKRRVGEAKSVLVCLDSNHTHDHVLAELQMYGPMVTSGSYCVVFDTVVENLPDDMYDDRPWDRKDNPKTAVWEFLKDHPEFSIDDDIDAQLMLTVAPSGFLRRA